MLFKVRGLYFKALDNISFSVNEGDFFGIIGESGSGKSTTGKCIIKLYQPTGGKIEIQNNLISNKRLTRSAKKWLHKNVQMIFQDPMASLNPTKNILQLISEPLAINKSLWIDAYKKWKELNSVSKYLFSEFIRRKNKILQDFKIKYITCLKEKINESISHFKQIENDESFKLLNFRQAREKIILGMDIFVEKINETTSDIYAFSKNYQDILEELTQKWKNQDYDLAYKNYEDLLQKYKDSKRIFSLSTKGDKIQKEKNELINEIKNLDINFKETYKQNFQYIKSWEATIKGKIKSISQNIEFSKDDLDYTVNLINLKKLKTEFYFVKKLKKYKYLSEDIITETKIKVENLLEKYFKSLSDFAVKYSIEFENVDIEQKNAIIKNLIAARGFAQLFYSSEKNEKWNVHDFIWEQFKSILDSTDNFTLYKSEKFDDYFNFQFSLHNDLLQLKNNAKENSDFNKNSFLEKRISLTDLVKQKTSQLSLLIANYKETEEYKTNSEKFKESNEAFLKAKVERNNHIVNIVKGEDTNKQREFLTVTNQEYSAALSEYMHAKKEFESIVKKCISYVKKDKKSVQEDLVTLNDSNNLLENKEINKNKEPFNFKNWFNSIKSNDLKYLKKEVKLRWKSLSAIEFEYNNVINEVKVNTKICEWRSWFNWIFYFNLKKIIKRDCVYKALDSVGLKREHAYRYPHEFSGGQRQRIVIARALINKPKIIIADEPISALDVSIQAQIINILQDLCKKQNVTILFIAHDLSMVNYACNNVIIMHRGRILEKGNVKKIFENPIHPYTKSLMKATPKLSRVHVDLAAFNENFTYDKEWDAFNKPEFIKINNDEDHQVFGTESQISKWKNLKYKDE
ncbi:MAG: ATP-binding cassette domain-containing protein [Malacoplasma sp.]|nr:ATP-binding cassette domain-containing protein [Malacoplasma sp.]